MSKEKQIKETDMANSRIMLVCKHCGASIVLGKGYFGSYYTASENKSVELNDFFRKHEKGFCSDDINCSDNARDHFVILEEGESLKDLPDVAPKSEVEKLQEAYNNRLAKDIQTNADFVKYAKAEVAREIFEEIEREITGLGTLPNNSVIVSLDRIAELKKKYTGEKE